MRKSVSHRRIRQLADGEFSRYFGTGYLAIKKQIKNR
jgi:hypothetical protein